MLSFKTYPEFHSFSAPSLLPTGLSHHQLLDHCHGLRIDLSVPPHFALIQSVLNTAARVTLLSLPSSKLSEGFLSHPKWRVKASPWPTGPKMNCVPHLTSSPTTALLSISSTHTILIALPRPLWVFSYLRAFRPVIPSQKACSSRYP